MSQAFGAKLLICIYATALASAIGCQPAPLPPATGTSAMPAVANTDADLLKKFVKLPYAPVRVQWATSPEQPETFPPGPTDWALAAVVEFSPEDFAQWKAGATALPQSSVELHPTLTPAVKDWLPAECGPAAALDASGQTLTITGETFDPAGFTSSPLLHGFVYPLPNRPAVLVQLHTL